MLLSDTVHAQGAGPANGHETGGVHPNSASVTRDHGCHPRPRAGPQVIVTRPDRIPGSSHRMVGSGPRLPRDASRGLALRRLALRDGPRAGREVRPLRRPHGHPRLSHLGGLRRPHYRLRGGHPRSAASRPTPCGCPAGCSTTADSSSWSRRFGSPAIRARSRSGMSWPPTRCARPPAIADTSYSRATSLCLSPAPRYATTVPPPRRRGSVLGPLRDGLDVFAPTGRGVRVPRWSTTSCSSASSPAKGSTSGCGADRIPSAPRLAGWPAGRSDRSDRPSWGHFRSRFARSASPHSRRSDHSPSAHLAERAPRPSLAGAPRRRHV